MCKLFLLLKLATLYSSNLFEILRFIFFYFFKHFQIIKLLLFCRLILFVFISQSTVFGGSLIMWALAPRLASAQNTNRLLVTSITTDNINSAVDAWLLDSANATATYGVISELDTSE